VLGQQTPHDWVRLCFDLFLLLVLAGGSLFLFGYEFDLPLSFSFLVLAQLHYEFGALPHLS
jgi:hypothetical protein